MSYESYESMMGLGIDPVLPSTAPGALLQTVAPRQNMDTGHSGGGAVLAIGALGALLMGVVVLGLAMPFALGAIGGAIAAPSGLKKGAAKKGAVYGGLIGIGVNIALSLMTSVIQAASGSRTSYIGGAGIVPLAVGLYIGYKQREQRPA